ncbi:uncharacterized protein MYCFIDRAFT_173281 [Pseudocercospora fijiensis CIRAD86]|uniref:Uncharacterized protein n=1 Tax=Pseudocercospora fijiensis (strain CIRAD86) TaxID=383855 RepID=M3B4J2_PSEFD|nr:uncharacterized protein MYCFIDRAFT_173281 [Pseudocercospora fijiensis CIRAD86]EME84257.1 hypothetical protein MYCFIDRAFT_173281 [Pseudocercospora fijiensis CIRAD86]
MGGIPNVRWLPSKWRRDWPGVAYARYGVRPIRLKVGRTADGGRRTLATLTCSAAKDEECPAAANNLNPHLMVRSGGLAERKLIKSGFSPRIRLPPAACVSLTRNLDRRCPLSCSLPEHLPLHAVDTSASQPSHRIASHIRPGKIRSEERDIRLGCVQADDTGGTLLSGQRNQTVREIQQVHLLPPEGRKAGRRKEEVLGLNSMPCFGADSSSQTVTPVPPNKSSPSDQFLFAAIAIRDSGRRCCVAPWKPEGLEFVMLRAIAPESCLQTGTVSRSDKSSVFCELQSLCYQFRNLQDVDSPAHVMNIHETQIGQQNARE